MAHPDSPIMEADWEEGGPGASVSTEKIAPVSCPEESWRSPQGERLLLNLEKMPGFLACRGEEFNPWPEMRLDCSELLRNKVLLKYKGDRDSF